MNTCQICGARLETPSGGYAEGYEDDEDYGHTIIYTGHGGNDLDTRRQGAGPARREW